MTTPMLLSLAITADATGVAPATAEVRREMEAVKQSTSSLAGTTGGLAAANDEAERSAQRLTQTLRGQGAAEMQLRANIRAMNGAAAANTANLAAQFQDIAVTSAMGMSPLQIALQQGTQLSAVLGPMGAAGAARSLAAALLSVVNPVSLITLGVVGLSAVAIQYFSEFLAGAEDSEEALERQADLINEVAKEWGSAVPALKAYVDELNRAKSVEEALAAGESLAGNEYAKVREEVTGLTVDIAELVNKLQIAGADPSGIVDLQNTFSDLQAGVEDATEKGEDAQRVQGALLNLLASTGIPVLADYAARFGELADQLRRVNVEAQQYRDPIQAGGILYGKDPKTGLQTESFLSGINPVDGFNRTPFQTEEDIMFQRGRRVLAEEEEKRRLKAANAGGSVDPYRDVMKSADDRIAQIRQEIDLYGQAGAEVEALRYEQELLSQATDKGRSLDEEQIAAIKAKAAEYGKLRAELASTKLEQDLLFEREQLFRSPAEQRVAQTLRGAGIDPASEQGEYLANQIRVNEELKLGKDLAMDFGSSLADAFADGKLEAEELLGIVMDLIQQLMNNPGALSGLGSLVSSFFGGGFASTPAAGPIPTPRPFRNGGTFTNTIVDRPTLFSYANGSKFGEMGEAGIEAVMPLKRDSQGRLGVIAEAANQNGGGTSTVRLIMPDGWRAEVVSEARQGAREDAVRIVQENDKARNDYYQAGGNPR